jgi:hypothetical protein
MTPYVVFWRWLPWALLAAGASPNQLLAAVKRLKAIEGDGMGTGQTGYLNGVEPYSAIADYVAHVVGGAAEPFWLISAERG